MLPSEDQRRKTGAVTSWPWLHPGEPKENESIPVPWIFWDILVPGRRFYEMV